METNNSKHLVIVTDAWFPQVNGVVNTLNNVKKELEKQGYRVSMITPKRSVTIANPLYKEIPLSLWPKRGVKRVGAELQDLNPDYIYIATEGPLGYAAVRHCKKHDLHYVTGFHTKFHEYAEKFGIPGGKWLVQRMLKYMHSGAQAIMAPTQTVADELKAWGLHQAKPWTRGVDTKQFHPGTSDVYDGMEGPIWLNVGRVSHEKNMEDFLALKLPGTKVVVGDGPLLDKLRKKYPDVKFVGKKGGKDLADYYRGASVFVFPSRSDTFGNVQTEALACGVPVVAYADTPSRDIITSDKIGVLAENGGLRDACMAALELKTRGCEQDCVDHVAEHYTWEKTASMLADALVPAHHSKQPPRPTTHAATPVAVTTEPGHEPSTGPDAAPPQWQKYVDDRARGNGQDGPPRLP